jgi:SAM-dependent methyltransferase
MSSDWQPEIVGITLSSEEASIAKRFMTEVHVADLETSNFVFLENRQFDAIILSHVLEHLAYPVRVLSKLMKYLRESGQVLIAVPNIMECRNRFRLLRGYFEYQESGIMDRTHLRFFTWYTADRYLIGPITELRLLYKTAEGGVPLGILRRFVLSTGLSRRIDSVCVRLFPNLFGWQIVMLARRIAC